MFFNTVKNKNRLKIINGHHTCSVYKFQKDILCKCIYYEKPLNLLTISFKRAIYLLFSAATAFGDDLL